MNTGNDKSETARTALPRARARFLEQSIRLEEETPDRIIRAAIYLTTVFLGFCIIWASVTRVGERVTSSGEVVPAGLIHVIEHLEGGIVDRISVRNGDRVKKGDILLHLLSSAPASDLAQLRTRWTSLSIKFERLQALILSRAPDFEEFARILPAVAENEQRIHAAQKTGHIAALAVLERQIDRQELELERQINRTRALEDGVKLAREQLVMQEQLLEKRLVSRANKLDAEARLAALVSNHNESSDSIRVIKADIAQTRQQVTESRSAWAARLTEESSQVGAMIAEISESMIKQQDRVRRLAVRATVSGIVEGMTINSANAVIKPGQAILKIMPTDEELIVESRVSTEDIGHVRAGQNADIKINSYDPSRFGSVKGIVQRISATTYLDERKNPYFLARIELSADHLGNDPTRLRILPGMTVIADIETGEKTVLDYLMKPVSRGFSNAFRER